VGVEEIFTTGDGAFPNPAARATSISGRHVLASSDRACLLPSRPPAPACRPSSRSGR
jgi:hypothetical protein